MFSVCYRLSIYIHFRQISQSSDSHSRDPGSVPGQSSEIYGGQRDIGTGLSLSSSVFFCPYRPLFVIDSEDTYLHCMLTTLCTQIWTCFIMKSVSLNKDQYRTAANMRREYFTSVHQSPITTHVSWLLPATISSDIYWVRLWPCASHHFSW